VWALQVGGRIKGWLIRTQKARGQRISCKGQLPMPPPLAVSSHSVRVFTPHPCLHTPSASSHPVCVFTPRPCLHTPSASSHPVCVFTPPPCLHTPSVSSHPVRVFTPRPCLHTPSAFRQMGAAGCLMRQRRGHQSN